MLRRQEKIVVLVQERAVQGNKGLPLLVVEFYDVGVGRLGVLGAVDLDTFVFHHDEAGVNTFDLGYKLFLRNWAGLRLLNQLSRSVIRRLVELLLLLLLL